MKTSLLLPLALSATLAGLSSAATITQTQSFAYSPNGAAVMAFNNFDTTLGTLTSVTVSVNMLKQRGQLEVDNDSTGTGSIVLTHQVVGNLTASVSLVKTGGASSVGQSGSITATNTIGASLAATTGDSTTTFNNTANTDYFLFTPGSTTVADSGNIDSAFIGGYASAGPGTYTITMNANQVVSATGLSALQQSFTVSDILGKVEVVYNYEAIPEPSGALLGGLGLLALLRRRRR